MPSIVFPDVCKTPAPGGPVPVPYPNLPSPPPTEARSRQRVKVADNDFDQHMQNLRAAGEADAGAANGVASAKTLRQKATSSLLTSFKVKVEGAIPAVLIGRGLMNHTPHAGPAAGPLRPSQTTRLRR